MTDLPGPDPRPPAHYPDTPPLAPPPPPVPPGAIRATGQWPGSPSEPPPPRRSVPFWVVAVAIVAVGALLGGLVAVITRDDADDPDDELASTFERETTTTEAPPDDDPPATTPGTAPPSDVDQVIADIEAFVAAERGLPFLRPVTVELAGDAEFEQRLLEDFDEDAADLVIAGQVLQAVGIIEPGVDIVEAFRSLLGAGVVGFYDPETDELVVRGTSTSPYVRGVIAHELTHALEDQHFELHRPELEDATDESGLGFTALVEGSASFVENAYRATFTEQEEAEALAEESRIAAGYDFDEIPLALFDSISAPYLLGPALIDAVRDEGGGQAGLDGAFAQPPTTSEALLQPETYLRLEGAVAVPAPVADGVEIDRSVIGAMGLAQLLGELTLILAGFGDLPASVDGWGGDAYVAWLDGDRVCLRANLVGDTPADTAEIGAALDEWASAPPFQVEATVQQGDVVTLTSCG
jgi:hypothetical protein